MVLIWPIVGACATSIAAEPRSRIASRLRCAPRASSAWFSASASLAPAFFSSRSRRSSTDCSLNLKAPMMIYFLVALADLTSERNQRTLRRVDWTVFFRRLLQEVEQLRAELDGGVDGLVGACVVRANQNEIFFLPVRRFETNRRVGCRTMFLRDHVIANAALALVFVVCWFVFG